ncbi:MAG: sulfite exporter TauE/SafE family protein [Burkholderiales bacterium]
MMQSLSGFEIAYGIAVVLLSFGLRGSTGFGGALGMPLLALVIPLKVLVPVWTLLGATSSIAILGHDRHYVARRDFVAFIPWCVIGVGAGLYFFTVLDSGALARGLGALILAYACYVLWSTLGPQTARRAPRGLGPLAGALSGFVGTLFGTMGTVFFAMYLDTRALAKQAFRATMSAMLLTLSVMRGIGYYATGEFTRDALILFLAILPVMLLGIYIGDRIHVRLSDVTFRRVVGTTLILCGVPLLLK